MRTNPTTRTLSASYPTNYYDFAANLTHVLSVSAAMYFYARNEPASWPTHLLAGLSIVLPAAVDAGFALNRSKLSKAADPYAFISFLTVAGLGGYAALIMLDDPLHALITGYATLCVTALMLHGATNSYNATDAVFLQNNADPSQAPASEQAMKFVDQSDKFQPWRHILLNLLANGTAAAMLGLMIKELHDHPRNPHMYLLSGILAAGMVIKAACTHFYNRAIAKDSTGTAPRLHHGALTVIAGLFGAGGVAVGLVMLLVHQNDLSKAHLASSQAMDHVFGAGLLGFGAFVGNLFMDYRKRLADQTRTVEMMGQNGLGTVPSRIQSV